ncbi:hypothetical protein BS47DRAFT_882803 [Hydnum rufescens UP504]|uniref:Uncharacterized protein n=1 Tax=Hydnum rufescens UP504 TaxID=1448309 RepID=A0A9P6AYM5_9AGAM|nr:hypothetical protein BS47DRAFT_882803 [Hydnum rufescens UP504]
MAHLDPGNWNGPLQNNFALRAEMLLIAEVGTVSFIAVTVLLAVTIRLAIKHRRRYGGWDSSLQPVSLLFLIAIFMDSVQALGTILTARWALQWESY